VGQHGDQLVLENDPGLEFFFFLFEAEDFFGEGEEFCGGVEGGGDGFWGF
jgi:hypothetical protein